MSEAFAMCARGLLSDAGRALVVTLALAAGGASAWASAEEFGEARVRAHSLAQQSNWPQAAQEFAALAEKSDQPADRLAAMRALAHVGEPALAIAQGERLLPRSSELADDEARAFKAELATLYESQAYRLRREAAPDRAANAFERAYFLDPSRKRLLAEAGYARLASGDRAGAGERFVEAVDALAVRSRDSAQAPHEAQADEALIERLRRELRELSRTWTLAAFQSWRASGSGPSSGFSGVQRDGLIAAQGGAELSLMLPSEVRGPSDARQAEVFLRMLWSQRGDSLAIDERSVQSGVGLRWQPIPGSALRLTAERLLAVGEDARTDWLMRASWGRAWGWDAPPGRSSWASGQVYVDVGHFFRAGGSNAVYAEARQGVALAVGSGWVAHPHLMIAMREVRPDPFDESWAEAGPGLALRRVFGGSRHEADRGRLELSLQYRFALSGAGRQGWIVAASLLW
jgi:hypothetical protein